MLGPHKAWLQRLGGTRLLSEVLRRVDLSFQPPFLQQILSLDVILITSLSLSCPGSSSRLYHLPFFLPASPPPVSLLLPPSEEDEGEEVTKPPEGKCT